MNSQNVSAGIIQDTVYLEECHYETSMSNQLPQMQPESSFLYYHVRGYIYEIAHD